ncbi:Protein kinase-like domain protein [Ascosphaera apis ARSEF 7405]|uniref:Protein kinase-like domain protein n=1 Tax=Ascosphaera apis ARSEF 7405 TaxID=392613 RepID=A0A168A6C3_9EURO|nr:Protein kinase-like domain protein [Ascosphaera apis ARSEF 7405]
MFANALKSFQSNINSNYQYSPHPAFVSGPWKVHDGKKKSTGDPASIFILDKKSLQNTTSSTGFGNNASRTSSANGGSGYKRVQEEAIQRLKKEASSLARLRHPSILQVLEPVEETRNGGLMFATEPVTASLSIILQEKDDQDIASGGRASRYTSASDSGPSYHRRELEIDEIEIQKGLLQVAKALEFLHESAGLVHGNLNPNAIYVNTKSDWKLSGLGFSGPPDDGSMDTNTTTRSNASVPPIALSEVLHHDPRLSPSVQLDIDFTSPDFVIDANVSPAADMYSLGLLIVALYNSPHRSPIKSNQNPTTYRKLISSSSSIPSASNSFLCSRPIPQALKTSVLPNLLARRPAQRLNSREFQQSKYFDNVLVSTIRFLESFPAKTQNEKAQFLRGLRRVLDEFPGAVLQRKVLPALLEETKDRELLPLLLQNVMKIIKAIPGAIKVVPEIILPKFKEIFLSGHGGKNEDKDRDSNRDAALMVILSDLPLLAENCSGRQFKEGESIVNDHMYIRYFANNSLDVLPLVHLGLDSHTHALIDSALKCLPVLLPILDFASIKDDVFPPIAHVFAHTNSLQIKTRALDCFVLLCGGEVGNGTSKGMDVGAMDDGLSGIPQQSSSSVSSRNGGRTTQSKKPSASILDKYTVQEKLVPLLKSMKTKEPAVMMASLNVLRQVSRIADIEFLAVEVVPLLWQFSLGPLLNETSEKIEKEQRSKLMTLSGNDTAIEGRGSLGGMSPGGQAFASLDDGRDVDVKEVKSDFEKLVLGHTDLSTSASASATARKSPSMLEDDGNWNDWGEPQVTASRSTKPSPSPSVQSAPRFSWSTAPTSIANPHSSALPSPALSSGGSHSGRLQTATGGSALGASPMRLNRSMTPDSAVKPSTFPVLSPTNNSLTPTSTGTSSFSQPLQPLQPLQPQTQTQARPQPQTQNSWTPGISTNTLSPVGSGFGGANPATTLRSSNMLSSFAPLSASSSSSMQTTQSAFSIPPPPTGSTMNQNHGQVQWGTLSNQPMKPMNTLNTLNTLQPQRPSTQTQPQTSLQGNMASSGTGTGTKSGLDKYESLL